MDKAFIYALSLDGETFRYIGKTRQTIDKRLIDHRRCADRGGKQAVYGWMRKHGLDNVVVTLLEEVTIENDSEREIFWIAYYRAAGYKLLNMTDGGTGGAMLEFSPETRKKLSDAGKATYADPAKREHISNKLKQTLASPEHRERIKRQRREMWQDEDFRAKHKEAMQRAVNRPGHREKRVEGLKRGWADPVTGAKRRAAIAKAMHVRWHVNRDIVKEECEFCGLQTN